MSQSVLQILKQKISDRSAVVAVIGLGYVGLPLVVVFGNAGYKVIGIDVDPRKVEKLNLGESYIQDVPTADIKRLVDAGLCMRPQISLR
jgi:UDP-N-acetyl-D-glucosamine dehydrogenase